jgi:beta-glucosidase
MMVSDWMGVAELQSHGVAAGGPEAAALALAAGIDMDMSSQLYLDGLRAALAADPALMALLDDAVRRVLSPRSGSACSTTPIAVPTRRGKLR